MPTSIATRPSAVCNSRTSKPYKYLHDDFAFGTRDELIPRIERISDAAEIHWVGLNKPFARIQFDFTVTNEPAGAPATIVAREHAEATCVGPAQIVGLLVNPGNLWAKQVEVLRRERGAAVGLAVRAFVLVKAVVQPSSRGECRM